MAQRVSLDLTPTDGAASHPFGLLYTDRAKTPQQLSHELDRAIAELDEELAYLAPAAGFSTLLRAQLAWNRCGNYCLYSRQPRLFNVHAVMDEISYLEGRGRTTRTKAQAEFSGPLKGFWHKHFFDTQFMLRNFINELENEDNFGRLWYRDFVPAFEAVTGKPWVGTEFNDDVAKLLAHVVTIRAYEQRAGIRKPGNASRMTGEWIVYAYDGSRRVYLTLALHSERQDSQIARLRQAAEEFPFVAERLDAAEAQIANNPKGSAASEM